MKDCLTFVRERELCPATTRAFSDFIRSEAEAYLRLATARRGYHGVAAIEARAQSDVLHHLAHKLEFAARDVEERQRRDNERRPR